MDISDFDFKLPPELIAQEPSPSRGQSRLFVLDRKSNTNRHHSFIDLVRFLRPNDVLVLNDTKVIPARLILEKPTGGLFDALLVRKRPDDSWECLAQPGIKSDILKDIVVRPLDTAVKPSIRAELHRESGIGWVIKFDRPELAVEAMRYGGRAPLPPYIKRPPSDDSKAASDLAYYQTVYANEAGSIAAPTAGLHFTPELLSTLEKSGVTIAKVTLHVGKGTFLPVKTDNVENHHMEPEFFTVGRSVWANIASARKRGGRVFAVGTTSCRVIEHISRMSPNSITEAISGSTGLFIYPPFEFKIVDALITNFHLPKGTPLMLASAFAGRDRVLAAYAEAIEEGYHFFSYGDAMLII